MGMRSKYLLVGLIAATATVSTVGACSHPNELAGDLAPARTIDLHVKNENFLDMNVYTVSDGQATRLGTVTGNGSRNFVLDASLAAQDLRIFATPIGGTGRAATGSIAVAPGQTVDFTIGSVFRNSTVFIR
jgi:hypothetical protein